jgi:hypothetical protein
MNPPIDIIAYCLGELNESERLEVARQAAAEPDLRLRIESCQRTLAELRSWPDALKPFVVSESARARLESIGQTSATSISRLGEVLQRFAARLVRDTAQDAFAPGFRGHPTTRHLRFDSDAGSIFVKVEPLPRGQTLLIGRYEGQRAAIEIVARSGPHRRAAPLDVMGFFELPVDAGPWELTLHLSDGEVVLPALDVGA